MAIIDDEADSSSELLNIDRLKYLVSLYKFPIILAGIGISFLIIGLAFFVRLQSYSSNVIFSSESSPSSTIEKKKIPIDIEGAVLAPGVYQVEEDSRITTALAAAGGLSVQADREWVAKNLNLAAKLTDGAKIYIPSSKETSSGKTPFDVWGKQNLGDLSSANNLLGITVGKVNINTALQAELEALPGIGPVTAGKIITGRIYQTIEELKTKKIVGNAVFEKIKGLITL